MAFLAPIGLALGASAASAATVGAIAASTAVSVLGTGAAALASSNAASFQADLQARQAKMATEQGAAKAGEVARQNRQTSAAARAGAIQNGFDLTGSTADLLGQVERQGELDYLTAVYDGSVEATGLNASAGLSRRAASNALVTGAIGAGTQAFGGAAKIYGARSNSLSVAGTG